MKKILLLLVLAAVLGLAGLARAGKLPAEPEPDKDTLLLAWERVQSQDPHTKKFEKLGERRYFLETDLFPFNNEIRILHLTVDDEYPEEIEGFIAVELTGVDKAFRERYQNNFRVWNRHNSLIWSADVNKWLTGKEYDDLQDSLKRKSTKVKNTSRKSSLASRLKTLVGVASFVFFWVFALGLSVALFLGHRKQSALRRQVLEEQRQLKALSIRLVKAQQNTNQLLQAIYKRLGAPKQAGRNPAPKPAPNNPTAK